MLARKTRTRQATKERRSRARLTSVLRIGLISDGTTTSFCFVKNISSDGVQVRLYSPLEEGSAIQFRVGDGRLLKGKVAWTRNQLAGIQFERDFEPSSMLRVAEAAPAQCRRSSPRVQAGARATLRTGGRTLPAELCDISAIGTKLKTRRVPSRGMAAILMLPDLPPIRGFVRWSEGELLGFMFEQPLPVPLIALWVAQRKRVQL